MRVFPGLWPTSGAGVVSAAPEFRRASETAEVAGTAGDVEWTNSPDIGEPSTLISLPSAVTEAISPWSNDGTPSNDCTQYRWCVPWMST